MMRPIFCRAVPFLCVAATLPMLVESQASTGPVPRDIVREAPAERELLACRWGWRRRECPPVWVAPAPPVAAPVNAPAAVVVPVPPAVVPPPPVSVAKPTPTPADRSWSLAQLQPLASPDLAGFPGTKLVVRMTTGVTPANGPLAFSANGQHVGFGCENGFWLADLKTGKVLSIGNLDSPKAAAMAIAADGNSVAVASGNSVHVWDVKTKERPARLAHPAPVHTLLYSADGELVTGWGTVETPSLEGGAWFWDIAGARRLREVNARTAVHALAFAPDTGSLAIGCWNGNVLIWDTHKREQRRKISVDGIVSALAFSPDGRLLAVGDTRGRLRRFPTEGGKERPTQFGHRRTVSSLAFTRDGKGILSAEDTGRVIHWDAQRGDQLQDWQFSPVNHAFTVTPDGAHVVAVHLKTKLVALRFVTESTPGASP